LSIFPGVADTFVALPIPYDRHAAPGAGQEKWKFLPACHVEVREMERDSSFEETGQATIGSSETMTGHQVALPIFGPA
jgi:hypothetical protein